VRHTSRPESGGLTVLALPFLYRSQRQDVPADSADVIVLADAATTDTALSDMAA
jgi:hypothetical protein